MAFLDGFEFDIFTSYGWAGAEKVNEGDRGWVDQFQQKLTIEMKARLGGRFEVYFDDYDQRNGFLYKNLGNSIEKSGALLFLVSPGSCRSDSWCRYELRHFLDQVQPLAHPGVSRAERLFKAALRRPDEGTEPEPLDKMVPYSFVHPRFNTPVNIDQLGITDSPAFCEFQKLCEDLEALFKKTRKLQATGKPSSGKTIFCGAVPAEMAETRERLVNNQDNNGHQVLLVTQLPGEAPEEFTRRTDAAIARADCSVHLFSGATVYEPSKDQCLAALQSAIAKVYVWENRDATNATRTEFMERIRTDYLKTGRLAFPQGGADGYLDANLGFDLAQKASPCTPVPAPDGLTAMVQFDADDQANTQIVANRLEAKHFHIQPPIFGGSKDERAEMNKGLYQQAQKVVVVFGETQDFWAFQTCAEIANALGQELTPARAALLLAPPLSKPPSKPFFSFRQFQVIKCSDPNWTEEFDQWADAPAAGGGQ